MVEIVTNQIDKSHFVEIWEKSGINHVLMLRPHGFGKSNLTEFLDIYYGHSPEKRKIFTERFSNSYISEHLTSSKGAFRVLKISFSNVKGNTVEEFEKNFIDQIIQAIEDFKKNNTDFEFEIDPLFLNAPDFLFSNLCLNFAQQLPKEKIFLIIEDYDNFACDVLFNDRHDLANNDIVNNFYDAIKSEINHVIAKTFITGVFPVLLGNLFSGVNSINNYSTYKVYHNVLGFDDDQLMNIVKKQVDEYQKNSNVREVKKNSKRKSNKTTQKNVEEKKQDSNKKDIDIELLIKNIKDYAGGYIFSQYVSEPLYNSANCIDFVKKELGVINKIDDARSEFYLNKILDLANGFDKYELLDNICTYRPIPIKNINNFLKLSLITSYSFDDILSLLFYLGFLSIVPNSIKTVGCVAFKCPNKHVEELFRKYAKEKDIVLPESDD